MYLQKRVPYYQSGQTPQYGKIRDPYLDEGNFVFSTFSLKEVVGIKKPSVKRILPPKQNQNTTPESKPLEQVSYIGTLYISGDVFFNGISWSKTKSDFKDCVYKGEIKNGKPNGQGTLTFDDGSRHVGEWKNGKRDGKGIFYSSSGVESPGVWMNGSLQFSSTPASSCKVQTTFGTLYISGDAFFNGISWSKTKSDFKDCVYKGDIKNGVPHGQGNLTFDDGAKYIGEWKNGKRDGKGIFYSSSGVESPGVWMNGSLQF